MGTAIRAAVLQPATRSPLAVAREVEGAVASGPDLLVLPELPGVPDGVVTDLGDALTDSARLVHDVTTALAGTDTHVVLSVPEHTADGLAHVGLVLDRDGVVHRQRQRRRPDRHAWIEATARTVDVVDLPFARLAVLVGEDVLDAVDLAVAAGADLVAAPAGRIPTWETVLPAAWKSIRVVVATRSGPSAASILCDLDVTATRATSRSGVTQATLTAPDPPDEDA